MALAPDLIVLDLPTGNGDAGRMLLQMLKAEPSTRQIPVVLCAADEHIETQRWTGDSIGVWVVHKPFTFDALLTGITAALNNAVPPVAGTSETSSQNGSTDHDSGRN